MLSVAVSLIASVWSHDYLSIMLTCLRVQRVWPTVGGCSAAGGSRAQTHGGVDC